MQDLTIQDWDMLINAREHDNDALESSEYYLDRETGAVLFFSVETVDAFDSEEDEPASVEWLRTEMESYRQIFEEPGRYIRIDSLDPREAWERMSAFAHRLDRPQLAERLHRAIAGKGAFRRFRDEVHSAGVQNDWYAYENHRQVTDAVEWLHSVDVRPTNVPPTQLPAVRSETEQRLDRALSTALADLQGIIRTFNSAEIDEIEATLLARRLGEKLADL